jgi:hypothetical protein
VGLKALLARARLRLRRCVFMLSIRRDSCSCQGVKIILLKQNPDYYQGMVFG